ncbi:MAG: hypothetical protein MZV70_59470 [Desulfobacterales bacterium]|nr:hypothetical protein [Desulfobacterales bacterium]
MAKGIHKTAIVSRKAEIDDDVVIGPFCIIGDDAAIQEGDGAEIECPGRGGDGDRRELHGVPVFFHRASSSGPQVQKRENGPEDRQEQRHPRVHDHPQGIGQR